jgi:hypothetical protein
VSSPRRVVLFDCALGGLWAGLGALNVGLTSLREAWWVGLSALVATAVVLYADEHGVVSWGGWERAAAAVVAVVASVVACAAVVFATTLAAVTVVGVALAGTGLGLLAYRTVYGVLRPLPEARLDGTGDRSV